MVRVHSVPDRELGNTAYVVDLGSGLGAVVDPRRDVDAYVDVARRESLRIVAVFETHVHADFVTGSLELVQRTSARVFAPADGRAEFDHEPVHPDQEVLFGHVAIRALATPGHTPEHLAYVVLEDGAPVGVFTGGSLIAGGAARTDLIAPERTEELARAQFRSLRLLSELPEGAKVWPTHGAGSFCSTSSSADGATTVAEHRLENPLLAFDDEDAFVSELVGSYQSFPPYFLELRNVNRAGPALLADLDAPAVLDPNQAADVMRAGAWLVDARPVAEWASAHLRGAVSIELRPAFPSWLGWVVPFGAPIVVVVEPERRDDLLTLARRIGYDTVVGWVDGGPDAWRRSGLSIDATEVVDAPEAKRRVDRGALLLDVRQRHEWDGRHAAGAHHLEVGDLAAGKLPEPDRDVIAYCGHGERSATAASLLEASGFHAANLEGGLAAWEAAGLPLEQ